MPTDIFDTFSFELIKWNKSINLIQEKTENTLYERHIKNSLDLKPFINYESDVVLDVPGLYFPLMAQKMYISWNLTRNG
jgi:16S rRNA G527 N7-methylase RsmG